MVMEYAVQPGDAKRILMSSDGIDGLRRRRQDLEAVAEVLDHVRPGRVRAERPGHGVRVGFDDSLWRTDDAGKTWKKQP